MANEYLLKMIVNGLHSLALDNASVCEYLNLRAEVYDYTERFEGTPFSAPQPPYPHKLDSQATAADLIDRIADSAALAVLYLRGKPAFVDAFAGDLDEADVLRLVLDWGIVQSGIYGVILRLYGQQPAPAAAAGSPGASSEERLWAEVAAWFTKIAADTDRVIDVQNIQSDARGLGLKGTSKKQGARRRSGVLDASHPLRRLEQGVHRTTLNTFQLAALLPHHLYHAARAQRRKRRR